MYTYTVQTTDDGVILTGGYNVTYTARYYNNTQTNTHPSIVLRVHII